jgi:hypothetical protein
MRIVLTGARAAALVVLVVFGAGSLVIANGAVKDVAFQRARADSLETTIANILAREKVMIRCTTADNSHACSPQEFDAAQQARDSLRRVFARLLGPGFGIPK